MATQILTAELDFDTLKTEIKTYLSQYSGFTDYDFDAAGLNILVEALAYNTHQMAKIANFSLNESFLDTAQLRASLVSHSKALGYTPRSRTAPSATIDVTALSVPASTDDLTLPKYSLFTTSVDSTTYNYYTLDEYTATEAGSYIFEDVVVFEGTLKTKKFFIDADEDEYPVYVIPDAAIDTSTMTVILRDGVGSSTTTTLTKATTISQLDSTSDIYLINEAPNGTWELTLGDGVIGDKPDEGTILEITYLATNGADSNGATSFSTSVTVGGFSLSPALVSKSAGGAAKENIESIRFNAPLTFSSQNRLVTAEDYSSFISNNTSFVEVINVWGGEQNVPVDYGTVYICVKPIGADAMTTAQQAEITTLLSGKSVLNIDPKYEDPTYQYFDITCNVKYDTNKTSLSQAQLETQIANTISTWGTDNLTNFDTTFYKSNLMTAIDASDEAIISSDVDAKIRKRFFPTLGALDSYTVEFTFDLLSPSSSTSSVVTSTGFTYQDDGVNYTAFLRNKVGSTQLEIYRLTGSTETIIVPNAGSVDLSNKQLSIGPIQPQAFLDATKGIEIILTPNDDISISPLRNQLLIIDTSATSVSAAAIS